MKDLEEFGRAKKAGHEFTLDTDDFIGDKINLQTLERWLEQGRIRIKPNKTYYRVYLDELDGNGAPNTAKASSPFRPAEFRVHDFEIEEPLTVTEDTTLYEHTRPADGSNAFDVFWMDQIGLLFDAQATGRTITAVIKGDES